MGIRGQFRNKRDKSEPVIVEALLAHGFAVCRIDTPLDLIIARKGKTWLAEVKTGKAKLGERQADFIDAWPGETVVLRSVEDVRLFAMLGLA